MTQSTESTQLMPADSSRQKLRMQLYCFVSVVALIAIVCVKIDALSMIIDWAERNDLHASEEIITVAILAFVALSAIMFYRLRMMTQQLAEIRQNEHVGQGVALLDPVTQLPNRVVGLERLKKELARADRDKSKVAVMLLDIDRFAQFNESFGQAVGDDVLRKTGERLIATIREMDTLVRMAGDEFLIIQSGIEDQKGALAAATFVMQALDEPLSIGGQSISISISAGVAMSKDGQLDADALIRNVTLALVQAKEQSVSQFVMSEGNMESSMRYRQKLETDLRQSFADRGLVLHYQPLFTVNNGHLLGFEALLRWNHPERGNISPAEFIPIAEESGLILKLGEWVLERACEDATKLAGEPKIAVNLSPVQFHDPDLAGKVAAILKRTGLNPQRLELEITEGVLIKDVDTALDMLLELKKLGVRISMDDFGTGYSSLSYLKRFPFDKIKIDRSFVGQLEIDSEDAVIVRAILAMGHSLGMIATAEGVESEEQLDYLLAEGCDEAQGFLLGKPMPYADAYELCANHEKEIDAQQAKSRASNDPYVGKIDKPRQAS